MLLAQTRTTPAILLLLALTGWAGSVRAADKKQADEPDARSASFIGTWLMEDVETTLSSDRDFDIHRYYLIKWKKGKLRYRFITYVPAARTRSQESSWGGIIQIVSIDRDKKYLFPM